MRRLLVAVVVAGLTGLLGQTSEFVHSAHEHPATPEGQGLEVPIAPDPDHSEHEHGLAPGSGTIRQPAPVIATESSANVAGRLVYRDGDGVVREVVLDDSRVPGAALEVLVVLAMTFAAFALNGSAAARKA